MSERRGTKALEIWCRRVTEGYENVKIINMSTSWRDGLAFCAIIHNFRPDLIDFSKLNKENIHYNNELAFHVAEKFLGIPSLLDPSDMVKYEVPDRLSILTYLSQFYQVLGNQEPTSNQSKNTTKKGEKTDELTTKMASSLNKIVVGVPKREPCHKCGNPVFLAERLAIEKKLYHRACLKCARCNSQLTLGSFYETEKDGEYCCETCPDEEIQLVRKNESVGTNKLMDRISFFENNQKNNVLKTSVSDEEKSNSLKLATQLGQKQNPNFIQMSNFLTESLDAPKEETSSDDDDDENEDDLNIENDPISISIKSNEIDDDGSIGKNLNNVTKDNTNINIKTIDVITTQLESIQLEEDESPPALHNHHHHNHNTDNTDNLDKIDNFNDIEVPEFDESAFNNLLSVRDSDDTLVVINDEFEEEEYIPKGDFDFVEATNEVIVGIEDVIVELREETEAEAGIVESDLNEKPVEVLKEEEIVVEIVVEEEIIKKEKEVEDQHPDVEITITSPEPTKVVEEKAEFSEEKLEVEAAPEIVIHDEEDALTDSKTEDEKEPTKIEEAEKIEKEEEHEVVEVRTKPKKAKDIQYPEDLNPFGDSEDEDVETPRPVVRKSMNPFGSEDEEEEVVKIPPPRPPPPKIKLNTSTNPFDSDDNEMEEEIIPIQKSPRRTPVPTPRKTLQNFGADSLSSQDTSLSFNRFGGSANSLNSSFGSANNSMARRKKGKAPPIPGLFDRNSTMHQSTSSLSSERTPKKKRPAPVPPSHLTMPSSPVPNQRLIALDSSLLSDDLSSDLNKSASSESVSVVYRRTIVPLPTDEDDLTQPESSEVSERQWEKMKDNKEAQNRNRQSQISISSSNSNNEINTILSNKSAQGKWKRRKGPAPALPVPAPQKKTLKMLPLQEIRHELEIIEVQQQGLEKQGVILEKMIRERCEGDQPVDISSLQPNSKEVEDLIMQLFELVNEKNELFRRQAELMYIRRQHRLEQEQADLEYEIRVLMAQPERNKTDSDKTKEEALIARLVEIVQLRNDVIDCLEMDRLREAEEDLSIKQSIEERTARRDNELGTLNQTPVKLSKKEKKKQKEAKKLAKSKKIDVEKDADETESISSATKEKKKRRKFLF